MNRHQRRQQMEQVRRQLARQAPPVDLGAVNELQASMQQGGVKVRSSIAIIFTEDGRVLCKSNVANRLEFNMMMTTVMQDMGNAFLAKEARDAAEKPGGGILLAGAPLPGS